MSTIYRLYKDPNFNSKNKDLEIAYSYLELISRESGLIHRDLVDIHQMELVSKMLVTKRKYNDQSGINLGQHFSLTGFGKSFCEYIENYPS